MSDKTTVEEIVRLVNIDLMYERDAVIALIKIIDQAHQQGEREAVERCNDQIKDALPRMRGIAMTSGLDVDLLEDSLLPLIELILKLNKEALTTEPLVDKETDV